MKTKLVALFAVMLAGMSGARAAVKFDGTANTYASNVTWTVSNLNSNPPSVSGNVSSPTATGVFLASGLLATNAGFTLNFTAAKDWNATAAQSAISGGTLNSYIATRTACAVSGTVLAYGVGSGVGDDTRFDTAGEVMFIKMNATNITQSLILKEITWTLNTVNDRADILIYHADSNAVTMIQSDALVANTNVLSCGINSGDVLILAVGASNLANYFRWDTLTLDIPSVATGVVPPILLTASAANTLSKLNWVADGSGALAYYNVYRSTTNGSGYTPIATGITTNAYNDSAVTNGTTYYYVATAVDTSAFETAYSQEVSATPAIPVPAGLTASVGQSQTVVLNWNASADALFASFKVYRTTTAGSNYVEIASGLVTNTYTDTSAVNETRYYYAVSHVDTLAAESALSAPVEATPAFALTVVELNNSRQAESRATTNALTGNYETIGSTVLANKVNVGTYAGILSRPVLKFPLQMSALGAHTTNDIASVVLRMYMTANTLEASSNGSSIEVYYSTSSAANAGVLSNDFESASFTQITNWTSITSTSSVSNWYEVDVTAAVLADLARGETGTVAGAAFRLQLNNDLLLIPTGTVKRVDFTDNELPGNRPELRIKWIANALLTVINGSGTGSYTNGQQVAIMADAPASGYAFDQWTGDTQYVASVNSSSTTVTMPAQAIALTATYILTEQYTTNGTPYSWLDQYGLTNHVADDALDQDVDGMKTWQEYIAGTIPTNAASVIKVAQATRNVVTWIPQSNRVYSVHWSTNLVQGFTNKQDNLVYPQGSWTNTTPDSRVNHYQVKVRKTP